MQRPVRRGWFISLLTACGFGYVIGAWHVTALRSLEHTSAADALALRFPQEWQAAKPPTTLAAAKGPSADADLLSPAPMLLPSQAQSIAQQRDNGSSAPPAEPAATQTASLDNSAVANAVEAHTRPALRAPPRQSPTGRPAAAARASYILDDAQIASIKQRLHLTPDQEQMWPAVEVALRKMSYKRAQQASMHGAGRTAQAAAVDPEAVQGLKSAAVPLIMSFSDEQKEQVRNLVHVLGLDQLASQF
jgi:hypothetical protein